LHAAAEGENGPLILFLHGFPEFWQAWHRQLTAFSRDHRAVALDLRGYNLSDKPEGVENYTLPAIVEDIRHVLQQLSPGRPAILVGHDWGGIAGWLLAHESPALLERMVIINAPHPSLLYRELKHNPGQALASSYAGFFQLGGVAETALRAFDFTALRKMLFGVTSKPSMFEPELRAAYLQAWAQPGALKSSLNYYRNIAAFVAVADRLKTGKIEVPTQVLWGEMDPTLLTANLVGLDEHVRTLEIKRHSSATHWIVHEEPDWVNSAIRGFLRSSV
jgi:pimeloyl-ACP methyl ester carboxylesterase